MSNRAKTIIFIIAIIVVITAWDVYMFLNKTPNDTISEIIRSMVYSHPLAMLAFLLLIVIFVVHILKRPKSDNSNPK